MDYVHAIGPDGELYHWGIKGMKWGQRRFQNKDGSLTPAGKKRYAKEEADLKAREKFIKNREREAGRRAKLDAKKAELDEREAALNGSGKKDSGKQDPNKPKTMKDMTDDELRDLTNRMILEKNYVDAQKNLAAATPKQVSAGKKFMDKYGDKLVESLVVEPTKKYVGKFLEKKLGLEDKDPVAALERQWKIADYKKKIRDANASESELGELERAAKTAKARKEIAEYEAAARKAASSVDGRTADDIIRYLSDLDEEGMTRLEVASERAKQYKSIMDLLVKEKESDKK